MAKIHVWIGSFQSEKDFNHYVDQSAYLKAWKMYNDGDADYKGDDEPNENLRCQFCKEINLDTFDYDFIVLKFNKKTRDIKQLISIIPADVDKLLKACKQKELENGNALIYYTDDDLRKSDALKCKAMTYLGIFEETSATVVGSEGQGLNNHLWAGTTKNTKEKFMNYFNQDGKECQFCKDVGIKKYNQKTLCVYYGKMDNVENIIKNTIPDKNLHDSMIKELETQHIKKINAVFCYIDNGYRDPKKDETFLIYKKEFERYKIKKTNKFIDEKSEYNGLKYIGCFMWD